MSYSNILRLIREGTGPQGGERLEFSFSMTAKTADYTVTAGDYGKVFTTRGAEAAVTFTLPAASSANKGKWLGFLNVADQNIFVAGPDEGLVVFNDLTADSIGFKTSSEKIAGAFVAISDGTSWIVLPVATETQTISVGTAASASPSATPSSSPSASVSSSPSSSPSAT